MREILNLNVPEEIRRIAIERKRQKGISKRVSQAYLALKPSLEILSASSGEWQDSGSYFVEMRSQSGKKNEFVVDGDNDATYKKSLTFLLQQNGNDLHNIAGVLLGDRHLGDINYDQSIQIIKNHLSGILESKKKR